MNALRAALLCPVVLACAGTAAHAQPVRQFDVPSGRLSEAVPRIAAQAGISISVPDEKLWRMRVRAVRGNFTAADALTVMLRGTGSRAVPLSATSWRIETSPSPPARPRPAPTTPVSPPSVSESDEQPIIVTASKLDMNFRDMATVAHVLGGDDLSFGGERGTESILSRLASITSTHLGSGRNKLFIRGMADSSFTGPTQSTVGEYLGDLRLSYNAPDPDLRLYDIDRVEILEGSQGTLYGAGSLSGIVRLIPNEPDPSGFSLDTSMGASLTQHGDPGGDMAATLNLPIGSGGHALRVTGYAISEGGYIDNPRRNEKDGNRTLAAGGRATLRLDLGDGWKADVGGIYQSTALDDAQYADRDGPPLTRSSAVVQNALANYGMAMFVVRKDWGSIHFQTSNAYVNHALDERFDAAPNESTPRIFDQHNRTELFASESRVWRPVQDGLGWLAGFSAISNRTALRREFQEGAGVTATTGVRNEITEFTAYGKVTVEPLTGLLVSAGGRLTHSRLGGQGEDVPIALKAAGAEVTGERTENQFLPSADVLYRLTETLSVFARYEEGFRPGGLAVEGDFIRQFRNDRVSSWEAGARLGGPGAPVAATISLVHTLWRDIQADFIDGAGLPSTANIGDGRITSLAGTLAFSPMPGLRIDLSAVYNHSRVTALTPEVALLASSAGLRLPLTAPAETAPTFGTIGAFGETSEIGKIPNVADLAVQGSVDYRVAVGRNELHLGGWAKYIGASRLGIGPVLGDEQGSYVDTGLAARLGDTVRGISITLTNLFDAQGNRFALGTPFDTKTGGFITPQRPRTLRVALDYRF